MGLWCALNKLLTVKSCYIEDTCYMVALVKDFRRGTVRELSNGGLKPHLGESHSAVQALLL